MTVAAPLSLTGVIAESPAMRALLPVLARLAEAKSPVLLEGESGSGKDLLAHWLHYGGSRSVGPLIRVHCPSIPEELLESELFGHERGAFTDAKEAKLGKIEMARGGTLYFDQVQDLSLALQAKLLRVVEERSFERVGGTRTIEVDVRFVSSTNVDLGQAVSTGRFREDLFHRLNVVPVRVPPLRERPAGRAVPRPGARPRDHGRPDLRPGHDGSPAGLSVAGQRSRAAFGRGEGVPVRRGRRRPAAGPPRIGPGAAQHALGRTREAPLAQGRGAGLHSFRARRDRRQPDPYRFGAGHQPQGSLGEEAALRDPMRSKVKAQVKESVKIDQKRIKAFREQLQQKKVEILEVFQKNKTYGKEADEDGAQDLADKASNSYTKEFLFSLSNSERDMVQLVDRALDRIEDKRFGHCIVCEEEMNMKRLEAVPWASHCLSCQEKQEQGLL